MKNFIWLLIAIAIISCSRKDEIRVSGVVENGGRNMIYLDEQGLGKITNADSVKLKRDGSFEMSDRVEVPTFYNLHMGSGGIIPLLIKPGDQVEIFTSDTGFVADYRVEGSEESQYLFDLNARMSQTRKSLDSLSMAFEENQDAGEEILTSIQEAYNDVVQSQRRYNIQFVIEHLNSMAAIYALYQKIDDNNFILNTYRDVQLIKITSEALDTIYPESEYVKSLIRDVSNLENEMKNRNWQNVIDGAESSSLPEIRLPEPHGDTIALSSLRGKVILLSFWASWNEESVNLNQEFIRLYNKYNGRGFEIYQVSFDTELAQWMTAINFDELPWINVSELSEESVVAARYNITELPSFFLIDRQGQITGKNYDLLALDRKIAELINQN